MLTFFFANLLRCYGERGGSHGKVGGSLAHWAGQGDSLEEGGGGGGGGGGGREGGREREGGKEKGKSAERKDGEKREGERETHVV